MFGESIQARIVLFVILVLVIPLISCGWFDTRDPADPSESNVPWRQPTQARYVVENLKNTVEGADLGLYTACVEQDSFFFHADPALVESDPARYENWDWQVEEAVTRLLFQSVTEHHGEQDSSVTIELSDEEWLVSEADSAVAQYSYDVEFHHGRAGVDSTASGTLRWGFKRNPVDMLWYLERWWDFATEGQGGWGAIKGGFRD